MRPGHLLDTARKTKIVVVFVFVLHDFLGGGSGALRIIRCIATLAESK
jgi:hypothetical protein